MVINENASKIYKFCVLQVAFFSLKFVYLVSFIISSHVITESSIKLAKYFPFSQLQVEEFQI